MLWHDFAFTTHRQQLTSPQMTTQQLLISGLSEMYWFENAWVSMLGQIGRSTCLPDLGAILKKQRAYTQEHVSRLGQIFGSIDEPIEGKECDALKGLIMDLKDSCKCLDEDNISCDISFALSVIKAANYQIGAYSGLLMLAGATGNEEAAGLIRDTISEEQQTITDLEKLVLQQDL